MKQRNFKNDTLSSNSNRVHSIENISNRNFVQIYFKYNSRKEEFGKVNNLAMLSRFKINMHSYVKIVHTLHIS